MRQIDMSAEAVTARLKLVSQLRRLCLSLATAKIRTQPPVKTSEVKDPKQALGSNDSGYARR
jgi:hypothetical protein